MSWRPSRPPPNQGDCKVTEAETVSPKDKVLVGILTGSPNDLPKVVKVRDTLDELGIRSEIVVASAHRTPDKVFAYLERAHAEGVEVLIGCAGVAAHLAGVIAGHTQLPVIGLPLGNGPLSGWDSLLSTVQMPPGVPVATVAIDGSRNAAIMAARILALKYPAIAQGLKDMAEKERARYDQTADEALARLSDKKA
nr:5-(carboxyamino)imidazole ribonucleotide mutase [Desulfuromonas sp. KJ2020]